MTGLLAILLAGAASYGLRCAFTMRRDGSVLPKLIVRGSALVAPAAFAALGATAVFGHVRVDLVASLPLIGGLIAAIVGVSHTGSANTGLVAGFPVVWILSALL